MSKHTCHVLGCIEPTPPKLLMCLRHWRMVPKNLQAAVNTAFRNGQCEREIRPSKEWIAAARSAIQSVQAELERTSQEKEDG